MYERIVKLIIEPTGTMYAGKVVRRAQLLHGLVDQRIFHGDGAKIHPLFHQQLWEFRIWLRVGVHQNLSGRVDRASATETIDSGSITGRVKPKTIKTGIHSFPA